MNEASPFAALRGIAASLQRAGKRFALVGGFAVSVRAEPRFTRDVDLCVVVDSDEEAEQLAFDLRAAGYTVAATVEHEEHGRLSTVRLHGPQGVLCDLLLASSGIEREVVERSATVEVNAGLSLPVARVEELLALKVLSSSERRPQDLLDFRTLIELNPGFDRAAVEENLRLIEARGYHRGQALCPKLTDMLRAASV